MPILAGYDETDVGRESPVVISCITDAALAYQLCLP